MAKNVHLNYLAVVFFFSAFQLILELCKGSGPGSQNSQVIQNYLEKLPLSTDVSALKEHYIKNVLRKKQCNTETSVFVSGSSEMQS